MIITKLHGGLGNQMFQYAAGRSLALHHNTELLLETSFFTNGPVNDEFPRGFEMHKFIGVNESQVSELSASDKKKCPFLKEKMYQKILPPHKRDVYKEKHYHFDSNFFNGKKDQYLKGYWQSEKFFLPHREEIVAALQLKDEYILKVKQEVESLSSLQTVSVHVRRGDYLRKPEILEWHGIMNEDYYAAAFELFSKKINVDKVFYFSDDPEWIQEKLIPIMPGTIVSDTIAKTQYEDFYWMSQCRHNIIANSSFSWWAAYLNPNTDKIIVAPKKWYDKAPVNYEDVYPPSWIRI